MTKLNDSIGWRSLAYFRAQRLSVFESTRQNAAPGAVAPNNHTISTSRRTSG